MPDFSTSQVTFPVKSHVFANVLVIEFKDLAMARQTHRLFRLVVSSLHPSLISYVLSNNLTLLYFILGSFQKLRHYQNENVSDMHKYLRNQASKSYTIL